MIVGTEKMWQSTAEDLADEWASKKEEMASLSAEKTVRKVCKVMIKGFPIKVWYSLHDCFYGNWGNTNTVVRCDYKGLKMLTGKTDSLHETDVFNPEGGGMKPLDWKVAEKEKVGKKVFSMSNQKSSNKLKTSVPFIVNNDGAEIVVHEKNIQSWINNYRKLFVEQPFRLTAEVVEQFKKDSESMSAKDSDKLWKAICNERG